ncbi:TIGR02234 family membrane protein [Sphaerisporangium rhizosphaerae]|uniref:TIGR02234 family membrane protein n=1 Tax=Sphaerisporangium rhizosphaerae TaxID=2269375 RepID=A0ABW2P2E7_9ACTN
MTAPVAPARTGAARGGTRRGLLAWVAAGVLGAALILLASGRVWAEVAYPPAPGATRSGTVALSGGDLAPVLSPLALACLAAVVAVLATRGLWRRVVGALIALLGAAAAVAAGQGASPSRAVEVAGPGGTLTGLAKTAVSAMPAWPIAAAAGGLALTAAGAVAAARGGRWPAMSERYERRGPRPDGAASGERGERPARSERSERSLWDALDQGVDPTEGEGPDGRQG